MTTALQIGGVFFAISGVIYYKTTMVALINDSQCWARRGFSPPSRYSYRARKQGGLYRTIRYRPRNGRKQRPRLFVLAATLWLRLHHYIKPASRPKEYNSSEQSSRPDSGFPQSRKAMLLIVCKVASLSLRQSLAVDTNVIHYAVEVILTGREGLTTNHERSW